MEKYIKEIKIGNIVVKNNVFLAPMAGVTDAPFRYICNKYGGCIYSPTEMVSSKGLIYNDHKTHKIMDGYIGEYPHVVQLFGSDVNILKKVILKFNENDKIDIIDFNMGCPMPKVTKNGDGSELLKDLKKVEEIISAIMEVSKKPVTVKLRLGIDNKNIVAPSVVKICEKYGVSMVVIHGRTKQDLYSGKVNLEEIKKVKVATSICVIGNGDIVDIKSAREMFDKTNVDGIMIGRGALGNPWIFRSIIEGREYIPSLHEKYNCILEHINEALKFDKEEVAIKKLRKHLAWYLKGLKNNAHVKNLINKENTYEGVIKILNEYFKTLEEKDISSLS